jgi:hypothetical protein
VNEFVGEKVLERNNGRIVTAHGRCVREKSQLDEQKRKKRGGDFITLRDQMKEGLVEFDTRMAAEL